MEPTASRRPRFRARWILLLLPYVALCFPQLYARATPAVFGFPFFYWYQLLCVIVTSGLLYLYYRSVRKEQGGD